MPRSRTAAPLLLSLVVPHILEAQTAYFRHAVFDNSLQSSHYYYSTAQATAPSTL